MNKNHTIPLYLILLLSTLPAYAIDLGVAGTTWPIAEQDVRISIVSSAAKTPWQQEQEKMTSSAKNYIDNLPKRTFPPSPEPKLTWLDLSIEINRDIDVPVKNTSGTYSWTQLVPKGTRVNPLATKTLPQALFFFDGNDPKQILQVEELLQKEPTLIMPIEAGQGNINSTTERLKRPVFYASDYMLQQFHIQTLPTLSFQGASPNAHLMASIALPPTTPTKDILYEWTNWPEWKKTFSKPADINSPKKTKGAN